VVFDVPEVLCTVVVPQKLADALRGAPVAPFQVGAGVIFRFRRIQGDRGRNPAELDMNIEFTFRSSRLTKVFEVPVKRSGVAPCEIQKPASVVVSGPPRARGFPFAVSGAAAGALACC
jgi:hypothetical protein